MMEIRKGFGVSGGYSIGEAFVFEREEYRIYRGSIKAHEAEGEVQRLRQACEAAAADVRSQIVALPPRFRDVAASILEAQVHMLLDAHLQEEIATDIRKNLCKAEYSASRTIRRKMKILEDSAPKAFAQRVLSDMTELEKALLRSLLGSKREDISHLSAQVVIVAHDLSPGQAISLDRTKVVGILTEKGGPTSHTAIVAKSLGIPAVVGVEGVMGDVSGGDTLILDGASGTVLINPDEAALKRYQALARNFHIHDQQRTREQRDLPAVTRDGTRIEIFANIETPEEIPAALELGAEGVGLYRTEFLYLKHGFTPREQDHVDAYRKAVRLVGNRRIIIRTVDLGADKLPAEGLPREENPFLGTRAIRLCFERPEMFKSQLRAILATASSANVGLMIPMISSLSEVLQVRLVLDEVREGLRREGLPSGEGMQLGIMVEVPSAAVVADLLAPHVDFLSVGTNDLIAYTIAVDRMNERVAALYQPAHPAILRLLKGVIDAGARHGKAVSVCGEMSSDPTYALLLLGMGLRNFSVAAPIIPELKKIVRAVTIDEARAIADKASTFTDARATVEFLRAETRRLFPDMP